jgi:hypothetical protein
MQLRRAGRAAAPDSSRQLGTSTCELVCAWPPSCIVYCTCSGGVRGKNQVASGRSGLGGWKRPDSALVGSSPAPPIDARSSQSGLKRPISFPLQCCARLLAPNSFSENQAASRIPLDQRSLPSPLFPQRPSFSSQPRPSPRSCRAPPYLATTSRLLPACASSILPAFPSSNHNHSPGYVAPTAHRQLRSHVGTLHSRASPNPVQGQEHIQARGAATPPRGAAGRDPKAEARGELGQASRYRYRCRPPRCLARRRP